MARANAFRATSVEEKIRARRRPSEESSDDEQDIDDNGADLDSSDLAGSTHAGSLKRARKTDRTESTPVDEDSEDEDEDEDETAASESDEDADARKDVLRAKQQRRKDKERAKAAFFAPEPEVAVPGGIRTFADMSLNRPLLRAITSLGFVKPTPIQSRGIPVGLMGRDVCACAATGSGKTAAFSLPILERLLLCDRRIPTTRAIILSPTRELAAQVHAMIEALAKFTDISQCLVVGGLSEQAQVTALRRRPDIIVATPGRLIDHVRNSTGIDLSRVEVVVLDEADRLLDEGFEDELNEILRFLPRNRQTMLFSATMTDEVEELVKLSMKEPVRIFVDPNAKTAARLTQEFVRVRENRCAIWPCD
jgi:ATP-dependent RNA helicase DDX27